MEDYALNIVRYTNGYIQNTQSITPRVWTEKNRLFALSVTHTERPASPML